MVAKKTKNPIRTRIILQFAQFNLSTTNLCILSFKSTLQIHLTTCHVSWLTLESWLTLGSTLYENRSWFFPPESKILFRFLRTIVRHFQIGLHQSTLPTSKVPAKYQLAKYGLASITCWPKISLNRESTVPEFANK